MSLYHAQKGCGWGVASMAWPIKFASYTPVGIMIQLT